MSHTHSIRMSQCAYNVLTEQKSMVIVPKSAYNMTHFVCFNEFYSTLILSGTNVKHSLTHNSIHWSSTAGELEMFCVTIVIAFES